MTLRHQDDHTTHYLVLFVGLFVFLSLFFLFRYNRGLQLVMGGVGAVFYMGWGLLHHFLEERLTKLVVLEYVLFGILAFVILATVLTL